MKEASFAKEHGHTGRKGIALFYFIKINQKKTSIRYFTLFLTANLFFVLNVAAYSQGLTKEREEDEDDSRKTITAPFYPSTDLDFKFSPGSAIQVTIWQEPDLSGNFSIDSQGYVILPLIGKVNVIRFTPESLKSYLKEEYSSYLRNPIIQILPLIRISVLGNVLKPGLYRVELDRPLWDVIELAGGPTDRGDVRRMIVMRGGLTINENLLEAYEKGISLREIGIESGDQVIVRRAKGPFPWRTLLSLASISVSIWAIVTRR